jgi:O-acetylhomoserine (thiol)-lyase
MEGHDMSDDTPLGFETRMIHAGAAPDPATGARQTPIYQTSSFVFNDAAHAARLFSLQEVGYIYSRLTNPTVSVLQERIASLEGGVGAVAAASGHAAQIMALFPLMGPGLNIVASDKLYGGTVNQFGQAIKRFGWGVKFVDFDDTDAVKNAIDDDTRAIWCESLANPGGIVTDVEAISAVAKDAVIPLIVDNTMATAALWRPIEHGADLVCSSTTKFMSGNGTAIGGIVVDSGNFDWTKSDKFPSLTEPAPEYHGLKFAEALGPMAYTFHSIAIGLRDLGGCQQPQNAFYTLLGLETLALRMERHCQNAQKVAEFLEGHAQVEYVSYPGLKSSKYHDRAQKYLPNGAGAVFTVGLKGGYDAGVKLVENLELFSHLANIGDARSLIIHSASTTHSQLSDADKALAGAGPEVVRLSIGLETADDLIADLDKALSTV